MATRKKVVRARRVSMSYLSGRCDRLDERLNEMEGMIAHLTGVVKAVHSQINIQDVLAPHIATVSTRVDHLDQVLGLIVEAKNEMRSALDVARILMAER